MLTQSGKITILVYLEPPNPVLFELWPNLNLDGAILESRWYPNINNIWTTGSVASTNIVNVSGRFTTYLIPPKDDTYTIYYHHDNAGRIYFEGIKEIDDWGFGVTTQSFTVAMKAGQNYKIIAEFNDFGLPAKAYIILYNKNKYKFKLKNLILNNNEKIILSSKLYIKNIKIDRLIKNIYLKLIFLNGI